MKITVGFRWEPCHYGWICFSILNDEFFYKITGLEIAFHIMNLSLGKQKNTSLYNQHSYYAAPYVNCQYPSELYDSVCVEKIGICGLFLKKEKKNCTSAYTKGIFSAMI